MWQRSVGGQAHTFVDLLEADTGVPNDGPQQRMTGLAGEREPWEID